MLLMPIATYLLLFVATATITADQDDRYPPLWNEAPSSIADYPLLDKSSGSQTTIDPDSRQIDPWVYLDRLGLYKILIGTTTPLMPFCSSNVSNILFGLPSQFGWQFESNRLFSNGTTRVSNSSWWASANYYLSVIPFLAAVDAGIIQQGSFRIVQRENFCSNSSECFRQVPDAMTKWRLFFANLQRPAYCPSHHYDDRVIDRCYLAPMWSAHVASIENALPLIKSKVDLLPSHTEQRFGLGWANLVGFIAMSRKNTNLLETNKYQDSFLPRRMLRENDKPPHCEDLSRTVNEALALFLSIRDEWLLELNKVWKRVTCNYEARVEAQHVLETAATSKLIAAGHFSAATANSVLFKCDE